MAGAVYAIWKVALLFTGLANLILGNYGWAFFCFVAMLAL